MNTSQPSTPHRRAFGPALCLLMLLALTTLMHQAAAQTVREIYIPMKIAGPISDHNISLYATEYRPEGEGPFPLAVINHGLPRSPAERLEVTGQYREQSLEFVRRGFMVINPVRRGYGKTGGTFAEGDYNCAAPHYYETGLETAKDILATIEYARTRNDIDASRILLVGQSAGGFGALAAASIPIPGLIGVVSFSDGRGSRGPNSVCAEDRLVDAVARYAATTQAPTLWIYAENDSYFGPGLVRRLVEAYRNRGARVDYQPQGPFGNDGHSFFSASRNIALWSKILDKFLTSTGFSLSASAAP